MKKLSTLLLMLSLTTNVFAIKLSEIISERFNMEQKYCNSVRFDYDRTIFYERTPLASENNTYIYAGLEEWRRGDEVTKKPMIVVQSLISLKKHELRAWVADALLAVYPKCTLDVQLFQIDYPLPDDPPAPQADKPFTRTFISKALLGQEG